MLIYALVAMLFCILVLAYVVSDQDLFHPWVIATASFLNSAVLAMLNLNYWQYDFHANTCLIIVVAVLCFGAGSIFVSYRLGDGYRHRMPNNLIRLPGWMAYVAAFLIAVMAVLSLQSMYSLSVEYGNIDGYAGMLPTVRRLFESRELVMPRWQSYRLIGSLAITITFLGVYIFNTVFGGWKKSSVSYLLPLVAFVPHIVLTTGRIDFLKVTLGIVLIGGILYQIRYGSSFRHNIKIIGYVGVAFFLFFLAFFAAGSLTWKGVSADHGPFAIISHYTGAQIPAFDFFVNGKSYPEDLLVGKMTLVGIYSNLRTMGVDLPQASTFLEFTAFVNVDTNVYTPLRAYIQDYGYVGMGIVCFLIGLLTTLLYQLVKSWRLGFYGLLVYVVTCWPLFLFGHGETFFSSILSTTTIYLMVILYFCYRILLHYNPRLNNIVTNMKGD